MEVFAFALTPLWPSWDRRCHLTISTHRRLKFSYCSCGSRQQSDISITHTTLFCRPGHDSSCIVHDSLGALGYVVTQTTLAGFVAQTWSLHSLSSIVATSVSHPFDAPAILAPPTEHVEQANATSATSTIEKLSLY